MLKVVGSRSHLTAETQVYLAGLGEYELVSVGSSLKFCLLAEGRAHLYPRLGPTCEWDTAAAQAVVEGAGGHVRKPWRASRCAMAETRSSIRGLSRVPEGATQSGVNGPRLADVR